MLITMIYAIHVAYVITTVLTAVLFNFIAIKSQIDIEIVTFMFKKSRRQNTQSVNYSNNRAGSVKKHYLIRVTFVPKMRCGPIAVKIASTF